MKKFIIVTALFSSTSLLIASAPQQPTASAVPATSATERLAKLSNPSNTSARIDNLANPLRSLAPRHIDTTYASRPLSSVHTPDKVIQPSDKVIELLLKQNANLSERILDRDKAQIQQLSAINELLLNQVKICQDLLDPKKIEENFQPRPSSNSTLKNLALTTLGFGLGATATAGVVAYCWKKGLLEIDITKLPTCMPQLISIKK